MSKARRISCGPFFWC